MSKQRNAIYLGQDNREEVEVVFERATWKHIRALAKRAKLSEVELLAQYLADPSIAALAGIAHRQR